MFEAFTVMKLADIDRVGQQTIEMPTAEWPATGHAAVLQMTDLGTNSMERRLRAILAIAVFDHSCLMEERGRPACDDGRIATDDTWTRRHAASRRSDLSRTY